MMVATDGDAGTGGGTLTNGVFDLPVNQKLVERLVVGWRAQKPP